MTKTRILSSLEQLWKHMTTNIATFDGHPGPTILLARKDWTVQCLGPDVCSAEFSRAG